MSMVSLGVKRVEKISLLPCVLEVYTCPNAVVHCFCSHVGKSLSPTP